MREYRILVLSDVGTVLADIEIPSDIGIDKPSDLEHPLLRQELAEHIQSALEKGEKDGYES